MCSSPLSATTRCTVLRQVCRISWTIYSAVGKAVANQEAEVQASMPGMDVGKEPDRDEIFTPMSDASV